MLSGQEIYSDGKLIWTYDKSANEVTITKVDGGPDSMSIQTVFYKFLR